MMMMSRTCYYDTNDGLFNIMMMHDAKLLYEHDELLYILPPSGNTCRRNA